ncbi:Major histocompatibility complex class I-related gene protein, partial [Bienertia sinuspersici]
MERKFTLLHTVATAGMASCLEENQLARNLVISLRIFVAPIPTLTLLLLFLTLDCKLANGSHCKTNSLRYLPLSIFLAVLK